MFNEWLMSFECNIVFLVKVWEYVVLDIIIDG